MRSDPGPDHDGRRRGGGGRIQFPQNGGRTSALELLETYEQAGYVTPEQAARHRRHAIDAHRREMMDLLAQPDTDRFEYFRLLDSYRAAGFLEHEELQELEHLIEAKLNPEIAARRLFAEAQVALDPALQAELLHRYLMELPGFDDRRSG